VDVHDVKTADAAQTIKGAHAERIILLHICLPSSLSSPIAEFRWRFSVAVVFVVASLLRL
jgi:hypothetical protein